MKLAAAHASHGFSADPQMVKPFFLGALAQYAMFILSLRMPETLHTWLVIFVTRFVQLYL